MVVLGEVIHAQGRKLLQYAFGTNTAVAGAISVLLRIGWYMTSAGLLLWNLGSDVGDSATKCLFAGFPEARLRLGIARFTVGVPHCLNVLAIRPFQSSSGV